MKEKSKKIILYLIAGIFLFFLSCAIIFYFQFKLYIGLLWICYTAITIIILGIILKKPSLILSQVIILTFFDIFWIIDFFYMLITGNSFLGITNYFFDNNFLLKKILTLQHIFTIPLSVVALSLIKVKKNNKIILMSFAEIIFFYLLSFLLPPEYGINCLPISTFCTSFVFPKSIPYPLIWLVLLSSFSIISYYILTSIPFLKKKEL